MSISSLEFNQNLAATINSELTKDRRRFVGAEIVKRQVKHGTKFVT